MRKAYRKPTTSSLDINAIKARVKLEIEQLDSKQKYDALMTGIQADIPPEQHDQLLEQFIKLVHLLLLDVGIMRLSEREIRQAQDRGYAILMLLNIKPLESRLSGLYGELHIALSRIAKRRGKHFTAAWEHQLALIQSRRDPVGDVCFQLKALANRADRLGQFRLAQSYLAQILQEEKAQVDDLRSAKLLLLRQLRIQQRFDEFSQLTTDLAQPPLAQPDTILEVEWEKACLVLQNGGIGEEIWSLVKPKSSHYLPDYLFEAKLWALAVRSQFLNERLPKVQTILKNFAISRRESDIHTELIECFEEAYDTQIPIAARLRKLGAALERIHELASVELELLAWAAASRWLKRHNIDELSQICAEEYVGLSLKLTDGEKRDCLNLQLFDTATMRAAS
jgi:hypothetical protein